MNQDKAHAIGKCPICIKYAEIVYYKKDIGKEFVHCDENEYYNCFYDKDYPSRKLVVRTRRKNQTT
jgi:hypothetical protein